MQGIFQKENTDKALKYGIYRHLPTYEKIIRNLVSFLEKKWSSSYKGDSEYHGNAIPLYSGTKLYIKKEYIGILEQQFGTLMMKTCVQSYTQDY